MCNITGCAVVVTMTRKVHGKKTENSPPWNPHNIETRIGLNHYVMDPLQPSWFSWNKSAKRGLLLKQLKFNPFVTLCAFHFSCSRPTLIALVTKIWIQNYYNSACIMTKLSDYCLFSVMQVKCPTNVLPPDRTCHLCLSQTDPCSHFFVKI